RVQRGEAWAHWTYDDAGWRAANLLEGRREWRDARWAGIVALLGAAVRARRSPRGELFITPFGVYRRPGCYTPLLGVGQAFRGVRLVSDGGIHYLRLDVARRNQYGTAVSEGTRVLVTAAHIEDARLLVERFNTQI